MLYKFKTISIFNSNNTDFEVINNIHDDINIENIILENDDIEEIWKYLRNKKINIQKIFYLYYNLDFTIKEIAQELHLSESYIKNGLYRTLKELQEVLGKDCD